MSTISTTQAAEADDHAAARRPQGRLTPRMAVQLAAPHTWPAAAAALPAHHKHGLLDKKVILPAILAGLAAAGLAAWLSSSLDTGLLRKLFGLFLLYVGLRELFHKDPDQSEKDDTK